MAGAFDHRLHVVLPGDLCQLTQRLQLGKMGLVVGIRNGVRRKPSPSEKHTS